MSLPFATRMLQRPLSTSPFRHTSPATPRRTFWTLQRTGNPPPATSAYLVLNGLFVVLGADYAFAALTSQPSTPARVYHSLRPLPNFDDLHSSTESQSGSEVQHGVREMPSQAQEH